MNYQKIDYETIQVKLACTYLECDPSMLMYYAWPQTFSSTVGPFSGIGGQAFSTFTIEAYSDGRNAAIFCKGKFWKTVEHFDPAKAVVGGCR